MKKFLLLFLTICTFCIGFQEVYAGKFVDNVVEDGGSGTINSCYNSDSICCDKGTIRALRIVGFVINTIKILVPGILIAVAFYTCARALVAPDMKQARDIIRPLVVKFIVAIFIYFTPSILLGAYNVFDGMAKTKNDFKVCTNCLLNTDYCDKMLK